MLLRRAGPRRRRPRRGRRVWPGHGGVGIESAVTRTARWKRTEYRGDTEPAREESFMKATAGALLTLAALSLATPTLRAQAPAVHEWPRYAEAVDLSHGAAIAKARVLVHEPDGRLPGAVGRGGHGRADRLGGGLRLGGPGAEGPRPALVAVPGRQRVQAVDRGSAGPGLRGGRDRSRRSRPALRPVLPREGVPGHHPTAGGAPGRHPALRGRRVPRRAPLRDGSRGARDLPGRPSPLRARDPILVLQLRLQPHQRRPRGEPPAATS